MKNGPLPRLEALRRLIRKVPGAVALYQVARPPPEVRITRWLQAGQRLLREHGLGDLALTPEAGWFRGPWGAEFAYVPFWGAYGAEHGALHEAGELEHCLRTLPPGATVLDVGANLGTFCVNLAVRRSDVVFHAVEPVAATCEWLRANVRRNAVEDRVRVHRVALADRAGTMEMTRTRHTNNRLVPERGAASGEGPLERVEVVMLDDLAAREGIGRVALVKMDVEGAELLALQGGVRLLARDRPDLLLEVEERHLTRFGATIGALEDFLSTHGYGAATPAGFLPNNRLYVHGAGPAER